MASEYTQRNNIAKIHSQQKPRSEGKLPWWTKVMRLMEEDLIVTGANKVLQTVRTK
jgi:hypothetical protein